MLRNSSKCTDRAVTSQITGTRGLQSVQNPASIAGHPFPHPSLLPGHLFSCQSILISVPSSPALKTPGFSSCFTLIYWAGKPVSGLNWHSSIWGDDGRHQLHFWMEKKQHRSLLARANRVYSLVNLFKCLSFQAVPQRLEITLWGHGHQCHAIFV